MRPRHAVNENAMSVGKRRVDETEHHCEILRHLLVVEVVVAYEPRASLNFWGERRNEALREFGISTLRGDTLLQTFLRLAQEQKHGERLEIRVFGDHVARRLGQALCLRQGQPRVLAVREALCNGEAQILDTFVVRVVVLRPNTLAIDDACDPVLKEQLLVLRGGDIPNEAARARRRVCQDGREVKVSPTREEFATGRLQSVVERRVVA